MSDILEDMAGEEMIAAIWETANEVFGGNCTFVDDDLLHLKKAALLSVKKIELIQLLDKGQFLHETDGTHRLHIGLLRGLDASELRMIAEELDDRTRETQKWFEAISPKTEN